MTQEPSKKFNDSWEKQKQKQNLKNKKSHMKMIHMKAKRAHKENF